MASRQEIDQLSRENKVRFIATAVDSSGDKHELLNCIITFPEKCDDTIQKAKELINMILIGKSLK